MIWASHFQYCVIHFLIYYSITAGPQRAEHLFTYFLICSAFTGLTIVLLSSFFCVTSASDTLLITEWEWEVTLTISSVIEFLEIEVSDLTDSLWLWMLYTLNGPDCLWFSLGVFSFVFVNILFVDSWAFIMLRCCFKAAFLSFEAVFCICFNLHSSDYMLNLSILHYFNS